MNENAQPLPDRPVNETILGYAPGSEEREQLSATLAERRSREVEVPIVVGAEEIRTGRLAESCCPHEHGHRLGTYHQAGEAEVNKAIETALQTRKTWSAMPLAWRAEIFNRAADLLSGKHRSRMVAATMLDVGKNVNQADIDVAMLTDLWRFSGYLAAQIAAQQPMSTQAVTNSMEYRALEGFVLAISPFNFVSLSANLATAPAIMGNVVLWKPPEQATQAAWEIFQILREAGLPDGVINFLPGEGPDVGDPALASEHLAGIHFTGSTATFRHLWRTVGERIGQYRTFPRLVGETGGKDFVVVHNSAPVDITVTALLRGAFELQGQKCSAASRAYVPQSLWPEVSKRLVEGMEQMRMGPTEEFGNLINAVIDADAYKRIMGYLDWARQTDDVDIIAGGEGDDSTGWFITPTLLQAYRPDARTMVEEIFGPVLTVYVYEDAAFEETLAVVDATSPYALTGSILATDAGAIALAEEALTDAAGNFYINDKPTGAAVGQQPFGGARASGTNDKAGSIINLLRWTSPRTIKRTHEPPRDWRYPFLGE
jgi:1-pyrroline-5-carboxylate dehydrogenase